MPRDTYLQPQAPDPVLIEETVLAITRRYLPEANAVGEVDETGGEARTYVIDTDFILKVQRPHRLRPRTGLEKEVLFLNSLSTDTSISVPKVLGYGRESTVGDIEYILMTRIKGRAFRYLNPQPQGEVRKA